MSSAAEHAAKAHSSVAHDEPIVEDDEMTDVLSSLTSIVPGGGKAVHKALRDTFNPLKKNTEDAWAWDRLLKQRIATVTKQHQQTVRAQYDALKKLINSIASVLLHKMFEGILPVDVRRVLVDARSTLAALERSLRLNLFTATNKLAEEALSIGDALEQIVFEEDETEDKEERELQAKYKAAVEGALKGLSVRPESDYEVFAKTEAEAKAAAKVKRDAKKAEKAAAEAAAAAASEVAPVADADADAPAPAPAPASDADDDDGAATTAALPDTEHASTADLVKSVRAPPAVAGRKRARRA